MEPVGEIWRDNKSKLARVTRCSTHDDAGEITPSSGPGSTTCRAEFWTELAASTMKPASCRAVTRLRRSACGFGDTPLTASCNRPSSASSPSRNASSAASARGERSRARAAQPLAHRAAPPRRSFAVDGLRPSRLRIRPSAWSSSVTHGASSDDARRPQARSRGRQAACRTSRGADQVPFGSRKGAEWLPARCPIVTNRHPAGACSGRLRAVTGAWVGFVTGFDRGAARAHGQWRARRTSRRDQRPSSYDVGDVTPVWPR